MFDFRLINCSGKVEFGAENNTKLMQLQTEKVGVKKKQLDQYA